MQAADNDNDKKWITNDSDGDGSDKGKLQNRPLANIKVKTKQIQCNRIMIISIYITSSIYRTRSYMKWRYGGVRHGAIGGNSRDIAFGVLALG